MTELPAFRYHPDPLATGSIAASDAECEACGQRRGYVYNGPVFAVDEIETLCPWCIADGSANETFDADFTDVEPLPDGIPMEVVEEICCRTPGFHGWQQERWLFHCNDGAEYLGRAGWAQIEGHAEAVALFLRTAGPPTCFWRSPRTATCQPPVPMPPLRNHDRLRRRLLTGVTASADRG